MTGWRSGGWSGGSGRVRPLPVPAVRHSAVFGRRPGSVSYFYGGSRLPDVTGPKRPDRPAVPSPQELKRHVVCYCSADPALAFNSARYRSHSRMCPPEITRLLSKRRTLDTHGCVEVDRLTGGCAVRAVIAVTAQREALCLQRKSTGWAARSFQDVLSSTAT
jgi:hypothetical protein